MGALGVGGAASGRRLAVLELRAQDLDTGGCFDAYAHLVSADLDDLEPYLCLATVKHE